LSKNMQIPHVRRRICPGHPSGWLRGVVDGVKILYCPHCEGVRLIGPKGSTKPSNILKMADICAWYLPKLETRSLSFLVGRAAQHYGMSFYTARRALHWLIKAGYYRVSIDGVVAAKDRGVTRELDELGDPPLLKYGFRFWRCGCDEIELGDVPEGGEFSCPRCRTRYRVRPGYFFQLVR